jgi:hypothetical protein
MLRSITNWGTIQNFSTKAVPVATFTVTPRAALKALQRLEQLNRALNAKRAIHWFFTIPRGSELDSIDTDIQEESCKLRERLLAQSAATVQVIAAGQVAIRK